MILYVAIVAMYKIPKIIETRLRSTPLLLTFFKVKYCSNLLINCEVKNVTNKKIKSKYGLVKSILKAYWDGLIIMKKNNKRIAGSVLLINNTHF